MHEDSVCVIQCANSAEQALNPVNPADPVILSNLSASIVLEDAADECSELRRGGVGCGDDLVDMDWLGVVGVAHVGDDREAKGAEAAVSGHNRFGNGRHADDIRADAAEEAIFGPRL